MWEKCNFSVGGATIVMRDYALTLTLSRGARELIYH